MERPILEVSKNPDKLFLVATGKLMIKVYGTSFKVNGYSRSNKITARLDEGSISLLLPNQQEQKLVYNMRLVSIQQPVASPWKRVQ